MNQNNKSTLLFKKVSIAVPNPLPAVPPISREYQVLPDDVLQRYQINFQLEHASIAEWNQFQAYNQHLENAKNERIQKRIQLEKDLESKRINELKKKAPGLSTDGSILTPTPNNNVIDSSTINGSNNDVNKSGADKLNTSNLDISEFDTLPQVESENLSTPDQQFMKDMMSLERKPVVSNSEDKKTHPITPTQPTTQQHLNLAQSSTAALQPMFQQMSLNNTPYIAGMGHQSTYQIPNHYLPPLNSSGGGPQNSNIQPIIPPKPLSSHVPPIPPKVNQYIDPNRSTSNNGGTHTDSWDRSDQKPALPKSLTPQQKKMVDFQNMGFENEGIERAMKRYDNEQDILDFLVEFARYQSQGHHPHLCEVLINNSKESIFDERTFIKNTSNLVEMGFAIELVTDALLATKNKEDAALDALINYST